MSSQGMQDHLGAKSANWLAGQLCCQPHFQFHEINYKRRDCKRGCMLTFLPFCSGSAKAMESEEVDGWHTSVLALVNEDVFAKQYGNKDAKAQTTYT